MPEQLSLITEPPAEDDAERVQRRAAYRERLRQYLQDPAFRAIEGFPIADDDAILALSDPPTYTACPNPFLPEILEEWQRANDEWRMTNREASSADSPFATHHSYHREPFAADVSEGKNDPLYNAHSYHTKVPHKAIMRYILHYTEPGDVVLDGFCGTGMTGVAAQLCGDRKAVEELGYRVDDAGNVYEASTGSPGIQNPISKIGPRRAILVDLSPAATFIAYNYNTPVDAAAFEREATRILKEVEAECGWMYETWHVRPSPLVGAEPAASPVLPSPLVEAASAVSSSLPSPLVGEGPGVRESEINELAVNEPDYWKISEGLRQRMVEIARQFRKDPTPSEAILWRALRGKQLDGVKFRRQQPIGPFVVDFYAPAQRLIVEVDGPIHDFRQEQDAERQQLLESLGLRFVRVSARLVETDLPRALNLIRAAFLPHPLTPSPSKGEGEQHTSPLAEATPEASPVPPSPLAGAEPAASPVLPSPLAGAEPAASSVLPFPLVGAEPAASPVLPSPLVGEGPGVRGIKGRINYTVWSDVFVCSECGHEIIFWETAVDPETAAVREAFPCPHCNALQSKRTLERAWETVFDTALKQPVRRAKQVPVLINYSVGKKRYEKTPDADDLALIQKIEESEIPYWFPIDRMPPGDESRRNDEIGMTHVHHFYTRRNLWVLAAIFKRVNACSEARLRAYLAAWFTSSHSRLHKMNRYMAQHKRHVGPLSGTLYISSTMAEISPFYFVRAKISDNSKVEIPNGTSLVTTQSSSSLTFITNDVVDYVFVDPPFGGNLMYSELNFLWESWLQVYTNNLSEAIINKVQRKTLPEYQDIMESCFRELYRVLKPGHWMTVEFHNSQNAIWNAIQEALQRAGFVIADVRILDKQKGTIKQLTYTSATKQDLIISAYKPNDNLEERFRQVAGTGQGVWDFVDYHLGRLPLPALVGGRLEGVAERQNYLLFDRMVAFHVQRGVPIPLNAAEFYAGLRQRYSERDKMYFLPEQAAEYDSRFLEAREVGQLPLIVTDRVSARQWVRLRLEECPRTEGELQPLFMREAQRAWGKNEEPVELRDILYEDFIQDDQGRWGVPDPHQEQHLAQLRERRLQRVFEGYLKEKGRLRVFRKEALLAGFRQAWREQRYADILAVAARLPPRVLQEDPQLLMYADNARIKAEG